MSYRFSKQPLPLPCRYFFSKDGIMKQNSRSKGFSEPPATSEILRLASVPPLTPLTAPGCVVGAAQGLLLSPLLGQASAVSSEPGLKAADGLKRSWISNVTEDVRGLPLPPQGYRWPAPGFWHSSAWVRGGRAAQTGIFHTGKQCP